MFNTNVTRLNFHYDDIYKTIIDKKLGLKISMGLLSGLRMPYSHYQNKNKGFCIGLQEQGMPQDALDKLCLEIIEETKLKCFDLLITKSDLPFDNRWYIAGDMREFLEAARDDKIKMPFTPSIYEGLLDQLEKYES